MFQLFHAGRANLFVFQCTQRKSSCRALQLLALNSTGVNQQKTKVEMMAMPFLRSFVSLPVSRPHSAVRRLERISSLFRGGSFSDFSPRMLNYSHLRGHCTVCDGASLCLRNSGSFAQKLSARQKSDLPSKKTQTDRPESAFWREWDRRKTGAYYILAAFLLAGGTVYLYQHRSQRSESACLAEVDVAEKETTKISGQKSSKSAVKSLSLEKAITQAADLCERVKDESGSPGLVVGVSIDGQPVWEEGFGYADVENRLPCKRETVFRIASISKSITMATIAKAMEKGDLDIDKPVQAYVPQFPEKTIDGKKVTVTTRHLLSHLGGIRHYCKKYMHKDTTTPTPTSKSEDKKKSAEKSQASDESEFQLSEYYIKDKFKSTEAALALFKDDPLVHKPGTKFLYSSHAWTLLAAVLEGATKRKYAELIGQLFEDLGLENTYLDENEPLIYNRARNYVRNKKGRLVNAPYVDCSYKYAGGGLLSTVTDLLHFANAMLYSRQCTEPSANQKSDNKKATEGLHQTSSFNTNPEQKPLPGYLKSSTVQQLWTPVQLTGNKKGMFYGMGWMVPGNPPSPPLGFGRKNQTYVYHTGAAIGASSILLILPNQSAGDKEGKVVSSPPRGVCVAMAVNMVSVDLHKTALRIGRLFEEVSSD